MFARPQHRYLGPARVKIGKDNNQPRISLATAFAKHSAGGLTVKSR